MHCDISARFFPQTPGTTRHDPAPAGLEACFLIPKFDCMNQTTAPAITSANPLLDFSGLPVTMSSLSGNGGSIAMGEATLTISQTGTTTFSGTVAGQA